MKKLLYLTMSVILLLVLVSGVASAEDPVTC